jgi:hypothetical protein
MLKGKRIVIVGGTDGVAIYFMPDASKFATGQTLYVDGAAGKFRKASISRQNENSHGRCGIRKK